MGAKKMNREIVGQEQHPLDSDCIICLMLRQVSFLKFRCYTFFECWAKFSRVLMVKSGVIDFGKSMNNIGVSYLVVGEAGIEPTTPGLEGRCSIQLSYSPTLSSLLL
jgi:hypothetical protein